MAQHPPRTPSFDAELRKLYPSNLKLQQIQIFLRHGERTPTSARFENAGLAAFWPYCSAVKQLVSVVMASNTSSWTPSLWRRHLETFGSDDNPVLVTNADGEVEGMCNLGELTDQGRRSTRALGARLRKLYIDQLRFLPSTITEPDMVYLRATRIPRAIESLQETFGALFPPSFRSERFPPPAIILRAATDETLNPNNGYCKRFAQLARAFSRRSAERWNKTTEMDYVNDLIGKWMPEGHRVAVDSQPRLSGILDTMNSTLAHGPGTRLPNEFYDRRGMAITNRMVIEEWFSGYSESREYRALGIGSLLGDVVSRMILSVEANSGGTSVPRERLDGASSTKSYFKAPPMLALSGCHDTTLAAILTSLGALNLETWPQFASYVTLELFRKSNSPPQANDRSFQFTSAQQVEQLGSDANFLQAIQRDRSVGEKETVEELPPKIGRTRVDSLDPSARSQLEGYYVRVLFNGHPVTVPGCKAFKKHLEGDQTFCTLEAFKTIVDKFTPLNWKQDCWSKLNDPAIPGRPEPAGY